MNEEKPELSSKEIYDLKKKEKDQDKKKEIIISKVSKTPAKVMKHLIHAFVIVGVVAVFVFLASLIPNLPPITQEGHSEDSLPSHINTTKMPDVIQRHMLEHSDGRGRPSIIIQYNCDNYDCEPDLVQKLTALVEEYPDNVYLAPNNYDGKIILTRLGKREILKQFDDQIIRDFIK